MGRQRLKVEGWCENDLKVLFFFQFSCQFLGYEEQFGHQKSVKGCVIMSQGQIREIVPLSPGKVDIFLIFPNFKFLGQGSYEITGGLAQLPPLVSNVVPKPLVSKGLKGPETDNVTLTTKLAGQRLHFQLYILYIKFQLFLISDLWMLVHSIMHEIWDASCDIIKLTKSVFHVFPIFKPFCL